MHTTTIIERWNKKKNIQCFTFALFHFFLLICMLIIGPGGFSFPLFLKSAGCVAFLISHEARIPVRCNSTIRYYYDLVRW